MNGTGEKLIPEKDAKISPSASDAEIQASRKLEKAAVEPKESRDFSGIYARLKKSARKKSVSIL